MEFYLLLEATSPVQTLLGTFKSPKDVQDFISSNWAGCSDGDIDDAWTQLWNSGITKLCGSTILLKKQRLIYDDATHTVEIQGVPYNEDTLTVDGIFKRASDYSTFISN